MSLNEQVIILLGIYRNFHVELLNAEEVLPCSFFTLAPSPSLRARFTLREWRWK